MNSLNYDDLSFSASLELVFWTCLSNGLWMDNIYTGRLAVWENWVFNWCTWGVGPYNMMFKCLRATVWKSAPIREMRNALQPSKKAWLKRIDNWHKYRASVETFAAFNKQNAVDTIQMKNWLILKSKYDLISIRES